jgi:hypothetical protein
LAMISGTSQVAVRGSETSQAEALTSLDRKSSSEQV